MLEKVWEVVLSGNPDCVVPYDSGFVVATYNLNVNTQEKSGKLLYFQDDLMTSNIEFDSGLLDLKIVQNNIISCCSNGNIHCISPDQNISKINITKSCCSYLAKGLDGKMFCSSLDGFVHSFDLSSQNKITSIQLNPYEIWFIELVENTLFVPVSIGKLMLRDIRNDSTICNLTLHDSEISSIFVDGDFVYCGSFDGSVSQTDLRNLQCVNKREIGGGVWRMIKKGEEFISGNMEEGFKLSDTQVRSVIKTDSLAYGLCEIQSGSFIGCSFYDSKLLKFQIVRK